MSELININNLDVKSKVEYERIVSAIDEDRQNSIETGYFVFTMMPSLRCKLRCPHCYLSLEQRTTSPIMSNSDLRIACEKVAAYYDARPNIKNKVIMFYWYGGEPTDMGMDYFLQAFKDIEEVFSKDKGYFIRHEILTALVGVKPEWYPIFDKYGAGHFQSSFDGLMRGDRYMKRWDKKVREAISYGLKLSTISVVNHEMVKDGPRAILDYLVELQVTEASFLPFMLNEQNAGEKYETFAPPMSVYSDFMCELQDYWYELNNKGIKVPHIGQMAFIASRHALSHTNAGRNIAGQTLFLLPEGDFVLPDYRDGYLEYMNTFGNIFEQSFEEILKSPARRKYLRRQIQGNLNPECLSCEHKGHCIMEFWKPNREGDECFGAKRYVEHVLKSEEKYGALKGMKAVMY